VADSRRGDARIVSPRFLLFSNPLAEGELGGRIHSRGTFALCMNIAGTVRTWASVVC